MTDRLSLTNALADANIERQKAERIATEIFDAIHDNVATKQDLEHAEAALKIDISAVRTEVSALEQRMLLRFAELEHRLTVRFASVMVVLTGIVLAAIRYLPHRLRGTISSPPAKVGRMQSAALTTGFMQTVLDQGWRERGYSASSTTPRTLEGGLHPPTESPDNPNHFSMLSAGIASAATKTLARQPAAEGVAAERGKAQAVSWYLRPMGGMR